MISGNIETIEICMSDVVLGDIFEENPKCPNTNKY
jgi:hypothetical protein